MTYMFTRSQINAMTEAERVQNWNDILYAISYGLVHEDELERDERKAAVVVKEDIKPIHYREVEQTDVNDEWTTYFTDRHGLTVYEREFLIYGYDPDERYK